MKSAFHRDGLPRQQPPMNFK